MGGAVLSVITGGGKWVKIKTHADPIYQHLSDLPACRTHGPQVIPYRARRRFTVLPRNSTARRVSRQTPQLRGFSVRP
jgi:hypothetical protein